MSKVEETIKSIEATSAEMVEKAKKRLLSLTKPPGSLGRLEEFAERVVAITGDDRAVIKNKKIFTFAGDHGVADEGVSAFPKEVTPQMVMNFLSGGAAINVLARHVGADVVVIDMGVDFDFDDASGLVDRKVMRGTGNIRKGPAMTREEALRCIDVGIELAESNAEAGTIYGTGDMGIANTTPSAAIAAVFTGLPVKEVTGRGTGIGDEALAGKVKVIEDAIKVNKPDPADPIDVLAKVGGTEIGAVAGLVIGAAANRVPLVIDGFISTAGALIAAELEPKVKDYLFAAHKSVERGHKAMLDKMGLRPMVDLDMRLGEGTGAALGISIIEASLKVYNEMATFEDAGVSDKD